MYTIDNEIIYFLQVSTVHKILFINYLSFLQ